MKLFVKRVPILNDEWGVYVIWGDVIYVKKWIKRHFNEDMYDEKIEEWCNGSCYSKKGFLPVILIKEFTTVTMFYSILAHEAVHAVGEIMEQIGEPLMKTEIFAHSIGAIIRSINLEVLKKYLKNEN